MIRNYPGGDQELDRLLAAKRDGPVKMGAFGTVVYVYRIALEPEQRTNIPTWSRNQLRLYHPVNTPEEATEWLEYYKSKTRVMSYDRRPTFIRAYFIPATQEVPHDHPT